MALDALDLDRMKQVSVYVQRGCAGARAGGLCRSQGWGLLEAAGVAGPRRPQAGGELHAASVPLPRLHQERALGPPSLPLGGAALASPSYF